MATRNVTDVSSLITAIRECESNDTIEILNDIDWNDDAAYALRSSVRLGGSSTTLSNVKINGNNHAIYNMNPLNIVAGTYGTFIFDVGGSQVTVENLSFLNCDFGLKETCIFGGSAVANTTIKRAVVQGMFKYAMFKGRSGGMTIDSCMITCDRSDGRPLMANGGTSPTFKNCWIRLGSGCAFNGNKYVDNLNTCYIEGSVRLTPTSGTLTPKIFTNVQNSCINLSFYVPHASGGQITINDIIEPVTSGGVNIINVDKITTDEGYGVTEADSTSLNKLVTDAHMKDASYLSSVGFDIIV